MGEWNTYIHVYIRYEPDQLIKFSELKKTKSFKKF